MSERPNSKRYKVLSLFSGAGGLDLGFTGGFVYLGEKYGRAPEEPLQLRLAHLDQQPTAPGRIPAAPVGFRGAGTAHPGRAGGRGQELARALPGFR